MTKLENMIVDYKAKKEELVANMKAELAPIWAEVVKEQMKVKAASVKAKKEARIARLEEELAELKS